MDAMAVSDNRQFARWAGVASESRQDPANGHIDNPAILEVSGDPLVRYFHASDSSFGADRSAHAWPR